MAFGKEVAGVETTATVLEVNTEEEAEEATNAAAAKETTTGVVDVPRQRNSTSG